MKALKSWKWANTTDEEYKNIVGFNNYSMRYKIVMTSKGYTYHFCCGCGTYDNVSLFIEDNTLYVYSERESVGYAGVDVYTLDNGVLTETDNSIFLQSDYDFMGMFDIDNPETAVNKFFNYSTMHKCKLLAQYINY